MVFKVLPNHSVLHVLAHGWEFPWICDPMDCSVLMGQPHTLGCGFELALVIPRFH